MPTLNTLEYRVKSANLVKRGKRKCALSQICEKNLREPRLMQLRQPIGGMTTDAARRDAGELAQYGRLVGTFGDAVGERVEIPVHAHTLSS